MELFFVALGLAIVLGPLILSIAAMSSASRTRREVEELRRLLNQSPPANPAPSILQPPPAAPKAAESSGPKPLYAIPPPVLPLSKPLPPPVPVKKSEGLEVALGGKAASFIGIAAIVISIVLFVGYAIREGWIGPAIRIGLGLVSAGVMIAIGHGFHRRGETHRALARALTGGGASLFFFSVYAAYGFYGLIGTSVAAIGLVLSAVGVLGLSLLYNSQAVAILGTLGAFITPTLVGADYGTGLFPMTYIAVVNIPVLALGYSKSWRWLIGLAFAATWIVTVVRNAVDLTGHWRTSIVYMTIFHIQYGALNILQSRQPRTTTEAAFDTARLLFSGLTLSVGAVANLQVANFTGWIGPALFIVAAVHAIAAFWMHRRLQGCKHEAMGCAVIAVMAAASAIPVEARGLRLALGWGLSGAIVAWLAARTSASIFSLIGLMLGVFAFAVAADENHQILPMFTNASFGTAVLMCLLLGFQAWVQRTTNRRWAKAVNVVAILCLIGLVTDELSDWSHAAISVWWAVAALLLAFFGLFYRRTYVRYLALILFAVTILKVFFVDLGDLRGLPRIGAFFILGALLLVLSYAYQRVAPMLTGESSEEPA